MLKVEEIICEKFGEIEKRSTKEYKLKYSLEENILDISYEKNIEKEENENVKDKEEKEKIEKLFSNFSYDVEEKKVSNIESKIQGWNSLYLKLLLGENKAFRKKAVDLNPYYKNKESVNFILTNYSFMPFFLINFEKDEKYVDKKFYKIFNFQEIGFDIEKTVEEIKNGKIIKLTGKPSSSFKMYELTGLIREKLKLKTDMPLKIEVKFEGEAKFLENEFQEGEIKIVLESNQDYIKEYIYKFGGEKDGEY